VIKLTRSDPSKNMHRFYALQLAPTLFGEWVLVAEWGRIGSSGPRTNSRVTSRQIGFSGTMEQSDRSKWGTLFTEGAFCKK
jgi:predicted DNA-binding WGR domain protein